jgi:hypothetical protein
MVGYCDLPIAQVAALCSSYAAAPQPSWVQPHLSSIIPSCAIDQPAHAILLQAFSHGVPNESAFRCCTTWNPLHSRCRHPLHHPLPLNTEHGLVPISRNILPGSRHASTANPVDPTQPMATHEHMRIPFRCFVSEDMGHTIGSNPCKRPEDPVKSSARRTSHLTSLREAMPPPHARMPLLPLQIGLVVRTFLGTMAILGTMAQPKGGGILPPQPHRAPSQGRGLGVWNWG